MSEITDKINKLNKIDQSDFDSVILTKKLNVKSKGHFYKFCRSLGLINIQWVRKNLFSIDIERSSKKIKKTIAECNKSSSADIKLNKRVAQKFNHLVDEIAQKRASKGRPMSSDSINRLKIDIDSMFPKSQKTPSQKTTPPKTPPPIPKKPSSQPASWKKLWDNNPADHQWFEDQFCTQNHHPIPPSDYPVITPEDLAVVRDFYQNSENFRPPRKPGIPTPPPLTKNDLETLLKQSWIGDKIILAFIQNLRSQTNTDKVHTLDPRAFDQLLAENEDPTDVFPGVFNNLSLDFYSKGKLLIPIYQQNRSHWTLVVADFEKKTISSYDSLGPNSSNNQVMGKVVKWMDFWSEQKGLQKNNWSTDEVAVPQQNNGSDCGAFLCRFMEKISQDNKLADGSFNFNISAVNMPYYRFQILFSIAKKYKSLCENP